jgi:hypothetical protein
VNHRKTTNLNEIRRAPRMHTWGPVTTIYDIGRYSIVEYVSCGNFSDNGETRFAIYVGGESMSVIETTLERAMVTAVAYGLLDEHNTARHMAQAACRLLKPE